MRKYVQSNTRSPLRAGITTIVSFAGRNSANMTVICMKATAQQTVSTGSVRNAFRISKKCFVLSWSMKNSPKHYIEPPYTVSDTFVAHGENSRFSMIRVDSDAVSVSE